ARVPGAPGAAARDRGGPQVPRGGRRSPRSARPPPPVTTDAEHGRVFSSPLARRILRAADLDIGQVGGTGPGGRIVRRDAERAVAEAVAEAERTAASAAPEPAAPATPVALPQPPAPATGFHDVPHTRLRRAIANRLTASKQTIPHFYLRRTARIDALLALRQQLNAVAPHKISVNDLVIAAVAVAHREVPDANVIWTDDGMRRFESVDVAVAVASERGLVTPVLTGVERMSPSAIAREVKDYVRRANEGALQQRDLEGGSITVTNLGMYGVEEFSAIINPPHSAILAVGAGRPAPVVVDGAIEVATQMALVLSVDHRAIDGALAAQWMGALINALEEPLRLVA
ncbi:2-oxo acid dehydrogenase subunit E2, partial [Streptomyces sp. NPDC056716]|uniref:2-oxo acid dehydrogenase subunit E2 n=1 Tax=Streptomyces sp. NPDC056716 TaxID=3345922 RepID=UPI0036BC13FC